MNIDNLTQPLANRENHLHGNTMNAKTDMSIFKALNCLAVQSQFHKIYMARILDIHSLNYYQSRALDT